MFQSDPGLSADQLAQFQFFDDIGNAIGAVAAAILFNGWTELVPIPEAGTSVASFLALGVLVCVRRPRLGRKK